MKNGKRNFIYHCERIEKHYYHLSLGWAQNSSFWDKFWKRGSSKITVAQGQSCCYINRLNYFQTMSPRNLRAGTPRISTSTSGACIKFKAFSSESPFIISRARIWSCNANIFTLMPWIYYLLYTSVNVSLLDVHTFLFMAQNLQSEVEGGRTWFTTSRLTGTRSFFKEAHNLEDSLIAITFHKSNKSEVLRIEF